jgi:hypothetical protein
MYDPGVVKVLETLHDLEDVSGGQDLVQLVMHGEIVIQALTLTTEERENMKMTAMFITYTYHAGTKGIIRQGANRLSSMGH